MKREIIPFSDYTVNGRKINRFGTKKGIKQHKIEYIWNVCIQHAVLVLHIPAWSSVEKPEIRGLSIVFRMLCVGAEGT